MLGASFAITPSHLGAICHHKLVQQDRGLMVDSDQSMETQILTPPRNIALLLGRTHLQMIALCVTLSAQILARFTLAAKLLQMAPALLLQAYLLCFHELT